MILQAVNLHSYKEETVMKGICAGTKLEFMKTEKKILVQIRRGDNLN